MTARPALLRRTGRTKDGRTYLLRPASSDDAAALITLRDAVASEPGLLSTLPGDSSAADEVLGLAALLSDGGLALVAEVDGRVCAHLVVQRRPGKYERHIGEVAILVNNTERAVGVGHALLGAAIDWGRAVRLQKLELSVFPENSRALALYRRCGFQTEGVRRAAVLMPDGPQDLMCMGLMLGEPGVPPATLDRE